nr:hypothetical protein [uncultured Desulfobulbus sp.]
MQIAATASTTNMFHSGLKGANEQSHLAAELISKTVEGLVQSQSMQTVTQAVDPVQAAAATSINVRA